MGVFEALEVGLVVVVDSMVTLVVLEVATFPTRIYMLITMDLMQLPQQQQAACGWMDSAQLLLAHIHQDQLL